MDKPTQAWLTPCAKKTQFSRSIRFQQIADFAHLPDGPDNTFLREKVQLWHERYGSNQRYDFKVPKKRKKPFRGESKGSDSNGASRSGLFAAVDYSPRGFKIGNWAVQEVRSRHGDPGIRQGSLERRFVPAPEDRMFFPTLIREDKYEERRLLKRSRKTKVKILQDAQQKYYMDKLDEEETLSKKLEEPTEPAAKKNAKQSEEDGKRKRMDEETADSIKRMKLVIVEIDDILEHMEQLTIEDEVVHTAHCKAPARKFGVCFLSQPCGEGRHVLARWKERQRQYGNRFISFPRVVSAVVADVFALRRDMSPPSRMAPARHMERKNCRLKRPATTFKSSASTEPSTDFNSAATRPSQPHKHSWLLDHRAGG
jgi:hypothetical protein